MSDSNKMIQWMTDRAGKVTYSMADRLGPSKYDCSSAVYNALIAGGFLKVGSMGNTETLFNDLEKNGWEQVQKVGSNYPARRGDIFIWGTRGQTLGAAGHTGIFTNNSDQIIHCNYGYNGITINDHDTIWGYNSNPIITIYRYVGKTDNQPTPPISTTNDVDYMRQHGCVQWNGKQFNVDDRSQYAGIWQVISNELGGLTPSATTTETEWINNGVPMSEVNWTDGTPQSSTQGTRFAFKNDRMKIVAYDVPSNGIAVMLAGHKVWVDATVARRA